MDDHRLQTFCLVVEHGSFSKAAEAQLLTQSAVSHLIRNLEEEMGVRLLNRRGRSVVPTSAGRVFYAHARKILGQFRKLEEAVDQITEKVRGVLPIGADQTIAGSLLTPVLYRFLLSYPEVSLHLQTGGTERIIGYLLDGKVDIGFVDRQVPHRTLRYDLLARDEIVLIASDENPLAREERISSRDLVTQPFILPPVGTGMRSCADRFFHQRRIEPGEIRILMTLDRPGLIVRMVRSGIGIAFVSRWSAAAGLREGTLRILNPSGKQLHRDFFLVRGAEENLSLATRTFYDFIREYTFFAPS
ncbi:MAG: LysR family transcriptional regulator [Deltaproteobacteria bacterium]|nr:LysR family transcriptional regulator [Deltaproteobacteria bacterium]